MYKEKIFFLYTMSRSGHHAIINWIQEQFDGLSIHYNHCFRGWNSKELVPMHGTSSEATRILNNGGKGEVLKIYSIEDLNPSDFEKYGFDSFPILQGGNVTYIWAIRDPYNWLVSSLKKKGVGAKPDIHMTNELGYTGCRIDCFIEQINEFNGVTNYIPHNILDINFNEWFSNKVYRKELALKLELPFTDAGLNKVSKFGGGSTFNGIEYKNKAQEMDVLNRWKIMKGDKRFLDCLKPELVEFSEKYFKFSPELDV